MIYLFICFILFADLLVNVAICVRRGIDDDVVSVPLEVHMVSHTCRVAATMEPNMVGQRVSSLYNGSRGQQRACIESHQFKSTYRYEGIANDYISNLVNPRSCDVYPLV